MKFKVIRQSKFNRKIEAFIESADSVIVSRLYDGVLIQIKDSTLYNVESGEIITNDFYKTYNDNDIIEACVNKLTDDDLDKLPEEIYQAVGPKIGSNWDNLDRSTLYPFITDKINFSGKLEQIKDELAKNDWFGVIILASKGSLLKCYLLDRQFFNLDITKNKGQKYIIDTITSEVVKKTGKDKEVVYRTVKELLNNLVIYKYVTSGHMTEFINKMINIINTEV